MDITRLETKRLILRQWQYTDFVPFAKLSGDKDVMKYFPNILSRKESNALAKKIMCFIADNGWGMWAVEIKSTHEFAGFVGLNTPSVDMPPSPCVEIGWRLAKNCWGFGYATEAGQLALNYAFNKLQLEEVVSFTTLKNKNSLAVMARLKMKNIDMNFLHPDIDPSNPLCEHVLYKITKFQWYNNKP